MHYDDWEAIKNKSIGLSPFFYNSIRAGWNLGFDKYLEHLEAFKSQLPDKVYEFAHAPWHYDVSSHQCLHDAWIEEIVMTENYPPESKKTRHTDLTMKLIGPYHDFILVMEYKGIAGYQNMLYPGQDSNRYYDLLMDEMTPSKDGAFKHSIYMVRGDIIIEAQDFNYQWFELSDEDYQDLKSNLYKYHIGVSS
jgi:hypothetical protein